MRIRILIIGLFFVLNSILLFGQCEYTLDNYTHNDCYGINNASIDISITSINASVDWMGPNGYTSSSTALTGLYSGTYYLTITNTVQLCTLIDSIDIEETIDISAEFNLLGRCNNQDSVDISTTLWGGTPPYSTVWSNGDTSRNAVNFPPIISSPYVLNITDANFCTDTVHLWLPVVNEMNPFMSSVGVICKDDNSGEARVFVQEGTPPFLFNWKIGGEAFSQENDVLLADSFSSISGLFPGIYSLEITDDMGCTINDSIEVKSNPNLCLTIYKAFSPNDDYTHEFWEIENIHLYPQAVVSVYDRNGREVFRRRNYINSEDDAFGGKDANNQPLPSATYYYVIDLENGDDVFKGPVTIVR
jgi:gliding motility-associated-like protein